MPKYEKPVPLPIVGQPSGIKLQKKRRKVRIISKLIMMIFAMSIGVIASVAIWFNLEMQPVDMSATDDVSVTIPSNSNLSTISQILESSNVINNSVAFELYVRFSGDADNLKAGVYELSPSESMQQIIKQLVDGTVGDIEITFYPGATLVGNGTTKYDVTTVLESVGYTDEQIAEAFSYRYTGPLFDGKPDSADLEGYIYGETYRFSIGTSAVDVLKTAFEEFYRDIVSFDLIEGFDAQGLNLYEAITLASIVQREANTPEDQKQIAQVFYSRLARGMTLGSDVTYQYIADKLGLERDPGLDNPYNTRLYTGLPPGPIAVPGLSALQAVAYPAEGDYLYFLSGDDDVTYFGRTDAEHQQNIVEHCQIKCLIL